MAIIGLESCSEIAKVGDQPSSITSRLAPIDPFGNPISDHEYNSKNLQPDTKGFTVEELELFAAMTRGGASAFTVADVILHSRLENC